MSGCQMPCHSSKLGTDACAAALNLTLQLLFSFGPLSPSWDHWSFFQQSTSWNRVDHVATSRTSTIISLICSKAETEDDVHVLWLYGTSSTGNSNSPFTLSNSNFVPLLSWYAYALMPLSLLGKKTVSHVVHLWYRHQRFVRVRNSRVHESERPVSDLDFDLSSTQPDAGL